MSDDATPVDRCPISRALSVVGNRSVMLIMREAYYGTTRFDDFARRVGIAESIAAGACAISSTPGCSTAGRIRSRASAPATSTC